MREEIDRIIHHYLAFTAPRELNLSHKDRVYCLHALQHTTHPSALLPAIIIAEATLRGQSHPNFIRWSICNGNKPRIFFVRTMGVANIIFGFVIAIVLTLSSTSRWWRIFAALEWFIGFSTMVAAYKGLCVILHKTHARNVQPWEHDLDIEQGKIQTLSASTSAPGGGHSNTDTKLTSQPNPPNDSESQGRLKTRDHGRGEHLVPTSMQAFGPKISVEEQSWHKKYEKKPFISKVFEKSVWTQDETLRVLQDKIVLGANIWAVIITVPLTVAFVSLPKGGLY